MPDYLSSFNVVCSKGGKLETEIGRSTIPCVKFKVQKALKTEGSCFFILFHFCFLRYRRGRERQKKRERGVYDRISLCSNSSVLGSHTTISGAYNYVFMCRLAQEMTPGIPNLRMQKFKVP